VNAIRVRRGFLGLSLCAIATLAGCGESIDAGGGGAPSVSGTSAKAGGRPKLIFVSNGNSDWWTAVQKGMEAGGEKFGADVELRRNENFTAGQIKILEDILSLPDVKGVAVSVYESEASGIADALKQLQEAGKIVITIDSDVSPQYENVRRAYVGTNNVKAGEVAGRTAAVLQPKGGQVCAFVGTSAAANARERLEGFFKGAGAKFDRKAKSEVFDDQGSRDRCDTNVQTAITKYPDLAILLGVWSYNGPRIGEQVKALPDVHKKAKVVTFDLDEQTVELVAEGSIDVTVCQNPYEMGYLGVQLLKALAEKDEKTVKEILPDGKTRDTGVRIVVPNGNSPVAKEIKDGDVVTIDEMKKWLASRGLKSS
jgi:ribose transport system substrate-binding protein